VFIHVLQRFQENVSRSQYVMTIHAVDEMDNDTLTIFDVEQTILTGHIIERQHDQLSLEWKYLVEGTTLDGDAAIVVAKEGFDGTMIIITVYRL
jgi:hypothetical protein